MASYTCVAEKENFIGAQECCSYNSEVIEGSYTIQHLLYNPTFIKPYIFMLMSVTPFIFIYVIVYNDSTAADV